MNAIIRILLLSPILIGCTATDHYHFTTTREDPKAGEKPMLEDSEMFASERDNDGSLISGRSKEIPLRCGNPTQGTMQAEFGTQGVYTVSFDLTPPTRDVLIGGVFVCEAIIEWSVAGNTLTRRVSVADGMSISGNANSVKVRVYDATTDVVLAGSAEPYSVMVNVSKGARSTSSVAPVYEPNPAVTILAPGGSMDVTVEDDIGANSVMVYTSAPPAPDVNATIAQQRASNALVGLLSQWDPYSPGKFVPLSANAAVVRVTAGAGPASTVVKVVFGIDG